MPGATPPLDSADISQVIQMAWDDAIPFAAIQAQFGLNEAAVIALMRGRLKPGSYRLWRKRVKGRRRKQGSVPA